MSIGGALTLSTAAQSPGSRCYGWLRSAGGLVSQPMSDSRTPGIV